MFALSAIGPLLKVYEIFNTRKVLLSCIAKTFFISVGFGFGFESFIGLIKFYCCKKEKVATFHFVL